MPFRGDERGVAVQVAAVVLLGFVVVSISLYQASVVPAENEAVEAAHAETVQGDMLDAHDRILGTARTGVPQPTTVRVGTRYGGRALFVNPPPPSGRLATDPVAPDSTIRVYNATALDAETDDYWNGTVREYPTQALTYRPDYNEFRGAPETTYANTVLHERYAGRAVAVTDQQLVEGSRLTLVTLEGSLSRARAGAVPLSLRPVSSSTRTVRVTNASGPVVVSVPTRLSNATWQRLLSRQLAAGAVERARVDPAADRLNVTLDSTVPYYQLRVLAVGVGAGTAEPPARYLTAVGGTNRTVRQGANVTVTVEARDRYDNPVSGVPVTAAVESAGGGAPGTVIDSTDDDARARTDAEGRASFVYRAAADQSAAVRLNVSFGSGNASQRVAYDVRPTVGGGTGTDPTRLVWDAPGDWTTNDEVGVVHADVGDRRADAVDPGYGPTDEAGDDLVAYWPLDGTDGPVRDVSVDGPAYDGTASSTGVTRGTDGVLNASAATFDDPDGFVAVPGFPNLVDDFSISAWIRTQDRRENGQRILVDDENSNTGYGFSLADGGAGRLRFFLRNGGNSIVDTGSVIEEDAWQHAVVVVDDGVEARIYVDGVEEARGGVDPLVPDTGTASIGGETSAGETQNRFDGRVDELRVYDRTLNASEVRTLYNGTSPTTRTEAWNGTLVAPYKGFDRRVDPANLTLSLAGRNSTVPAGTNVTVVVESDPRTNGTFGATSDPVVFGPGAAGTDRAVTGLTNRSARYRLRLRLNATAVTDGPRVDRLTLEAR